MTNYKYNIENDYDGYTVQTYLHCVANVSSRNIKTLKWREDGILLNKVRVKTIDVIKNGDILEINMADETPTYNISNICVKVVYEDKNCIIFNKPYNMPTHPSTLHRNDTLANVFMKYFKDKGESILFRPINRLDRDTTGLVLVAKNQHFASCVVKTIEKKYYCIINGVMKEKKGTIDLPIDRCVDSIIKRRVSNTGKVSISHYNVLDEFDGFSLLEVVLQTGRTHQIRVHFFHIGHSLVGDTLYGTESKDMESQALHCGEISFIDIETNEKIVVKEDFFYGMKNFIKTHKM